MDKQMFEWLGRKFTLPRIHRAQPAHSEEPCQNSVTLVPGEQFNPHKLLFGIFIPEALVLNPDLSPGAKLSSRNCRPADSRSKTRTWRGSHRFPVPM